MPFEHLALDDLALKITDVLIWLQQLDTSLAIQQPPAAAHSSARISEQPVDPELQMQAWAIRG
jgi:hypothetical protein